MANNVVVYEIRNGVLQPVTGSLQFTGQGAVVVGGAGNVIPNLLPGALPELLKDATDALPNSRRRLQLLYRRQ